jgi:hypothetical protein
VIPGHNEIEIVTQPDDFPQLAIGPAMRVRVGASGERRTANARRGASPQVLADQTIRRRDSQQCVALCACHHRDVADEAVRQWFVTICRRPAARGGICLPALCR